MASIGLPCGFNWPHLRLCTAPCVPVGCFKRAWPMLTRSTTWKTPPRIFAIRIRRLSLVHALPPGGAGAGSVLLAHMRHEGAHVFVRGGARKVCVVVRYLRCVSCAQPSHSHLALAVLASGVCSCRSDRLRSDRRRRSTIGAHDPNHLLDTQDAESGRHGCFIRVILTARRLRLSFYDCSLKRMIACG